MFFCVTGFCFSSLAPLYLEETSGWDEEESIVFVWLVMYMKNVYREKIALHIFTLRVQYECGIMYIMKREEKLLLAKLDGVNY